MNRSKLVLVMSSLLLTALAGANQLHAAENYDYPELLVTPRASDRMAKESRDENKEAWGQYKAIQASALVTLLTGLQVKGDPGKTEGDEDSKAAASSAGQIGMLTGGLWLGTTLVMSATFRPYKSGYKDFADMPKANQRDVLARERIAEEGLEFPGRLSRRLAWMSFISNAGVSGYMAAQSGKMQNKVYGGLSALVALAPFVFSSGHETLMDYHQEYKKKIYGPLQTAAIQYDAQSGRFFPTMGFRMLL